MQIEHLASSLSFLRRTDRKSFLIMILLAVLAGEEYGDAVDLLDESEGTAILPFNTKKGTVVSLGILQFPWVDTVTKRT